MIIIKIIAMPIVTAIVLIHTNKVPFNPPPYTRLADPSHPMEPPWKTSSAQ